MRSPAVILSMLLVLATVATASGHDRQTHPWGRFGVGSWKLVRMLKETFDEQGKVANTSTTETKTTLVAVDEQTYTLRVEVSVEVAGKRFVDEPRFVKRGFYEQTMGQSTTVRRLGEAELQMNNVQITSQVREITVSGDDTKRLTKLYFSPTITPHILKRETVSKDLEGKVTRYLTNMDVVAIDMPHKVLADIKSAAHVRTIHQQNSVSTITLEVHCADVPGGVVAHSSKLLTKEGRVLERSTLELVDYGVASTTSMRFLGRRRLFGRKVRKPPR